MEKHHSGFKLSEIDLEIRGPGEIYGTAQSGIPDLKMASLTDSKLVEKARSAAQQIIKEDPTVNSYPMLLNKMAELDNIYIKD